MLENNRAKMERIIADCENGSEYAYHRAMDRIRFGMDDELACNFWSQSMKWRQMAYRLKKKLDG